jgi:hypothetical protein
VLQAAQCSIAELSNDVYASFSVEPVDSGPVP